VFLIVSCSLERCGWSGLGMNGKTHHCNDTYMDLFYASTTITLGREKTPFWKAPWLDGTKPMDRMTPMEGFLGFAPGPRWFSKRLS
jgi:hypothetical protein